jgi:phosphatidate cytidylyltransferase
MAVIALVCIVASIIGDLGESTLKRWAKTKDSSDILPGHGGFFDRFDSIIYTAPAFYVVMKLFGY